MDMAPKQQKQAIKKNLKKWLDKITEIKQRWS